MGRKPSRIRATHSDVGYTPTHLGLPPTSSTYNDTPLIFYVNMGYAQKRKERAVEPRSLPSEEGFLIQEFFVAVFARSENYAG